MDKARRERLEARGFKVGDAADFLELSRGERVLLDLRMTITRRIRSLRQGLGLSPGEAAGRMGSTEAEYARIEACSPEVSLDRLFLAYLALGGTMANLFESFEMTHRAHIEVSGLDRAEQ
ncbi:transcriptional regulator [Singulisphaera sp. PoT]|uniref:transcriptional regulator n=1 Tax=Singulisphaera sp. PoT TaxID=3411797 RepID=UPI003BF4EF2A